MQTREWHFYEEKKKTWATGPWQSEPDKIQWQDKATKLPCLIVRQPNHGGLCGYVGVPKKHGLHGTNYDPPAKSSKRKRQRKKNNRKREFLCGINVHGGLTFSGFCFEGKFAEKGVCHVPGPGEEDKVWWFGFDTAHCDDMSPAIIAMLPEIKSFRGEYRNVPFMKTEIEGLAAQLKRFS